MSDRDDFGGSAIGGGSSAIGGGGGFGLGTPGPPPASDDPGPAERPVGTPVGDDGGGAERRDPRAEEPPPRPRPGEGGGRSAPRRAEGASTREPDDDNPYAAPKAVLAVDKGLGPPDRDWDKAYAPLAGRLTRLGAVILDQLVYFACSVPVVVGVVVAFATAQGRNGPPDLVEALLTAPFLIGLGITLLASLAIFGVNLYLLALDGQTLGKRWCHIRIVHTDRRPVSVWRLLGLRIIVPWVLGQVPYIGFLFAIADPLFIFSEERRCLHDHIADTIVVEA